jgi:hypothetical protein
LLLQSELHGSPRGGLAGPRSCGRERFDGVLLKARGSQRSSDAIPLVASARDAVAAPARADADLRTRTRAAGAGVTTARAAALP